MNKQITTNARLNSYRRKNILEHKKHKMNTNTYHKSIRHELVG